MESDPEYRNRLKLLKEKIGAFFAGERDVESARVLLAGNSDILDHLRALSAMKDSSPKDVPFELIGVNSAFHGAELLKLDAWLALKEGRMEQALSSGKQVKQMAARFSEPEGGTLLTTTAGIILGRSFHRFLLENLVSERGMSFGTDWSEVIDPPDFSASNFAELLRGEAHCTGTRILSRFCDGMDDRQIRQFVDAYALGMSSRIQVLETMDLESMARDFEMDEFPLPILEEESRAALEWAFEGLHSMAMGYVQEAVEAHANFAAFEILQREQSGEWFSDSFETESFNPVTGRPYFFDPATRELTVDEVAIELLENLSPIRVPELH